MKKSASSSMGGFTLIELLIVIAVIIILAAAIFVSLNPAKRFQDARNSTRNTDISAIVGALKTDQVDNGGTYLASVAALTADTAYQIGTAVTGCNTGCTATTTQAACADLTGLVTEQYLTAVPKDPSSGTDATTDYYIMRNAGGTITVGACDPEGGVTIVQAQ